VTDRKHVAAAGRPPRSAARRLPRCLGLLVCVGLLPWVGLLVACGEGTPEARLSAAGETLTEARDDAQEARSSLEAAKARLTSAESELYEARKAVRRAEKQVLSAEALVDRRASDVALFRRIQSQLLEAESLRQHAVTVQVDNQKVTLDGVVTSEAARQAALEISRSTPGVAEVRNRLDVESDTAS